VVLSRRIALIAPYSAKVTVHFIRTDREHLSAAVAAADAAYGNHLSMVVWDAESGSRPGQHEVVLIE
jgi:hypothetical protein